MCDVAGGVLLARNGWRWVFSDLADPASLQLLSFIFAAFWLWVSPLFNAYARHIEFEADRFGLELTHENRAMARAEADYSTRDGDAPEWDWFLRAFRATHPSEAERIRFANAYHPWAQGRANVYRYICH